MKFSKGFSLLELILVMAIISVGMVSIMSFVSYAQGAMDRARQNVIAINLSREGVESVYNIRDTNWLRRGGKKEECWLKIDPMSDTLADGTTPATDGCTNDPWLQTNNAGLAILPKSYILTTDRTTEDQAYRKAIPVTPVTDHLDLFQQGVFDDKYRKFALCLLSNERTPCGHTDVSDEPEGYVNPEGKFFRSLEVQGLVKKDAATNPATFLKCPNGETNTSTCIGDADDNYTPKELIFCVKTHYIKNGIGHQEICASLTNFSPS